MPTDEFDSLTGHAARHDALDAAVAAPTFVSATAPVDPAEGATWLDTSVTPNVLKVWVDGSPGEWVGAGGGGGGSSLDDWLENWFHYGDSITLTNAFKTATVLSGAGATGTTAQVRCGLPRGAGKIYFEILVDSAGPAAQIACGVANQATTTNSFVGASTNTAGNRHWCRIGSGNFARPGGLDFGTLATFTTGDVLGFALDLTPASGSRLMWVSKNGTFVGDPAAGTGATANTLADFVAPCAVVGGASGGGAMTLRLRTSEFTYSPPSGFSAWL